MEGFLKFARIFAQLILGTVVVGIIVNLISEEILLDNQGWLHAIIYSRLTPWLTTVLLLMAVIELLARKKIARFEVQVTKSRFWDEGWANNMPLLPLKFQVFLDMRNKGDVPGYINSLEIVELDTGTDLLRGSNATISCQITGGIAGGRRMEWPQRINAGDRIAKVRVDIIPELTERSPENFAARLNELKRYRIILKYEWQGIAGSAKTQKLTVEGNFDSFKAHVIEEWKNRGHSELVYSAKGI